MKETTTTRAAARRVRRYEAARQQYETEAARRDQWAAELREDSAAVFDAIRDRDAARLDLLADLIETETEARDYFTATAEAARRELIATRSALRAEDLPEYIDARPESFSDLIARSMSRTIDRREAETAADGRALRAKYANTRPTLSETMNADALQEAAAELLAMYYGDPDRPDRPAWIDGDPVTIMDRETGEPETVARRALPLAYVAAVACGRALDRVQYAAGGQRVKLAAGELRRNYRKEAAAAAALRAELRAAGQPIPARVAELADAYELREVADLLKAEAAADPENKDAARRAREAADDAARAEARAAGHMDVTETRKVSEPVAPSPEAAALRADQLGRVFAELSDDHKARALKLARAFYEGADTLNAAARAAKLPRETARRTWDAVKAAGRMVLAIDGDLVTLEKVIESDERARAAKTRREKDAATVRAAADLAARDFSREASEEARRLWAEVKARTHEPRLTATAKFTPADLAAFQEMARRMYHEEATR